MNDRHCTVEDFLLDEKFRNWVENPNEDSESFWCNYLKTHPEKTEEVRVAKEMLQKMKFKQHTLRANEVSGLWNDIFQRKNKAAIWPAIDEKVVPLFPADQHEQKSERHRTLRIRYLTVAASLVLLFVLTGILFWLNAAGDAKMYTTAYGETMKISLPDGSIATLNANSSLRMPANWHEKSTREVWLEGEAFFQVKKLSQNGNLSQKKELSRFVVYTKGLAVEVLGTQFNVNTRRKKVQVVLNSGKVRLKWKEQEVLMQPGELVEVSQAGKELSQRLVEPEAYSSWKDNHLVCDATPLRELAHTIEDRFGYQLVIQDERLKDIKVSGTIPLDSITTFNLVISRLIQVDVELKGDKVFIR